MEPWQAFIIASIYGFYVREDGSRLIQYVYIEEARKNGKSALAAALCLYHLIADGESGAEVYLAANSRDQVKLSSWPLCSNFAKGIDPNGELLDVFRDTVRLNLGTELAQSPCGGFDKMAVVITTAGFDKLGPCYQYRIMCTEVLNGLKTDGSLFAAIYSIDETDDWKDESVWIKSNPNLGVTVKLSYLRRQAVKAVNSPSEEVGIKTKNFNMWCDSSSVWIPEHYILSVSRNINLDDFKDRCCYAGIDLSSTSDLTAVSALFPDEENGTMSFKTWYYLPEAALSEKRFKELYGQWRRQGLIAITPGNVTDYDYILNDLRKLDTKIQILNIGYDQWNATQFVINAQSAWFKMEDTGRRLETSTSRPRKWNGLSFLAGHSSTTT
ncbi:Phage terminase-like protein, large subunit [Bacteroidales bacterium Barb4]|nr:Phage terminase-like protein, large subunit [Bacteroidales bacterium Barb4]